MRNCTRIAAYISNKTTFKVNNTNNNLETISITVNDKKLLGVYRQFKLIHHNNATDHLREICEEFMDHDIIIGDLNLDFKKKDLSSYRFSNLYDILGSKLTEMNFRQINEEITWSRQVNNTTQSSCLDHIYVKMNENNFDVFQIPTTSDHDLVGLKLDSNFVHYSQETIYIRRWNKYNQYNISEEILSEDWSRFGLMNSQDQCDKLDLNLTRVVERVTPTVRQKSRLHQNVWNEKINKLLSNKETIKRRLRRVHSQHLADRLKETNLKIKNIAEEDIKSKVRSTIIPGDQKSFWKALNLARNKGDKLMQKEINFGNIKATTNSKKADLFARFFTEKIVDLKSKTKMEDCFNGSKKPKLANENFFTHELVNKMLKTTKKVSVPDLIAYQWFISETELMFSQTLSRTCSIKYIDLVKFPNNGKSEKLLQFQKRETKTWPQTIDRLQVYIVWQKSLRDASLKEY